VASLGEGLEVGHRSGGCGVGRLRRGSSRRGAVRNRVCARCSGGTMRSGGGPGPACGAGGSQLCDRAGDKASSMPAPGRCMPGVVRARCSCTRASHDAPPSWFKIKTFKTC
jgi:hypothetical protein